jgi:TfoX/Sxy family transcriptional regulator of competence genes
MSTDTDFIEYVHEQAGLGGALTSKKMFGEYGIYFDGKIVAVAADNSLFLKPTDAGRVLLPNVVEAQPWPEAKAWFVLDEFLDDTELLQKLIRATADALPAPKPKPVKKPRKAAKEKKP